jgi:hypothetical protein
VSIDGHTRAWLLTAQRAVKTNNKGLAEFAIGKALAGPCNGTVCTAETNASVYTPPRSAFMGGDKE